ncbi:DapH/DapD/GlmU-related protein [Aliiroseovarius sp. KMU-50]|uniref:Chloramphenicol acetyltransferase n=1 Tax=Aliiroseovarius salicola TaxID=3009082 RepID=A0ABT4W5F2_9RHOB|nr:DapH/DapD/GlmU-related protein [Aliiroseovarius sp. KMU-50]MDA5095745.1 DapH/DapD/GlmU-related protein [Aliiroseovarius sp. KMU-50]
MGRQVWIGGAAIIQAGVIIGQGAVIGAGSVVTKDEDDGQIVVGNPARPTGRKTWWLRQGLFPPPAPAYSPSRHSCACIC